MTTPKKIFRISSKDVIIKKVGMSAGVLCCVVTLLCVDVVCGQSQAFQRYLHDDGDGKNFDQAILLHDIGDYSSCDTWECAEDIFEKAVFEGEMLYLTQRFGRPEIDWIFRDHQEVEAYYSANSRYFDNLDITVIATGEKKDLIFDITSSVDALKKKEGSIDPSAAAAKWAPDPIWPIYDWY